MARFEYRLLVWCLVATTVFLILFFGTFKDRKGWSRVQENIFGYARVVGGD